ncbi:Phosphotyrosyl phosphate activator protein-domain-containing protein [Radiomyces spectabilis]|uniref:Phosphotyrosyl phosphate activator protein-domain-containing protein n=1 Tax=Radiomyces spectabilis TaxID=64574 RepID=UPI0022201201|nr:Phosphotyrosyl phosphate activator protein-domain-containing protein [Radiomyces spectabilis]KAI8368320.1 Phosphotyrosyl phosphate activator protein-domain-containing protein [Radiomyces spectabilis]
MLDTLSQWVVEIPPAENSKSRFGNPSFQVFYDKVKENSHELMCRLVPEAAAEEVGRYFVESFGNRRRIDYGTGHEANFMAWLLCLEKLGALTADDDKAVVLRVFVKYIALMRKLQFDYWLEPAGSHGVWGLDDYHFLPFMFGSAQLLDHKYIKPKSIHDLEIVEEFSKSYMYLACIHFINTVKTTASLRWHSPMLDDISACKLWSKVNQGMIKMYKAEVMGKLPIMQHFMFGSLIRFDGGLADAETLQDSCGHVHGHGNGDTVQAHGSQDVFALGQEYPDCCGIPVPSAIAAAAAQKSRAPRPIPFD